MKNDEFAGPPRSQEEWCQVINLAIYRARAIGQQISAQIVFPGGMPYQYLINVIAFLHSKGVREMRFVASE